MSPGARGVGRRIRVTDASRPPRPLRVAICSSRYLGYQVGVFESQMQYHVGDWKKSGTRSNKAAYAKRQDIERRNSRYHKNTFGPPNYSFPNAPGLYIRQGLPRSASQFSTKRKDLKGVGVLVHDANEDLRRNPQKY